MVDVYIDPKIAEVRRIHQSAVDAHPPTLVIRELLQQHAAAIHTAFTDGNSAMTFHLGSWSPDVVGKKPEQIMQTKLNLAQVQESVAREYGFTDWQTVQNLADQQLDGEFESLVDFVTTGKLNELQSGLKSNPQLATQQSGYGHTATLLHYIGSNGVESQRQITPLNAAQIAQCLIDHGAVVNAEANMYGGGSTTLGLVLSSAHPANAGVTDALAKVLQDAGAS